MLILIPLIGWFSYQFLRSYLYIQSTESLQNLTEVFVSNLIGEIDKYSYLPSVLSTDPSIISLLSRQENQALILTANQKLEQLNGLSDSSDIYLMDRYGTTLATSNWQLERSFVRKNFSYRPYFIDAIEGKKGRYFAFGITSKQRGYFFSSPIYGPNDSVTGVTVVKVSMEPLEQNWQAYQQLFLITDEKGIVFSTNQSEWQFVQLLPLTQENLRQISTDKQYPLELLKPIDVEHAEPISGLNLLRVENNNATTEFLSVTKDVMELGWRVYALKTTSSIKTESMLLSLLLLLFFVLVVWLFLFAHSRRTNLNEQLEFRKLTEKKLLEAKNKLEQRVEERTLDLTHTNANLQKEIQDHQRTESELRLAQDGLIHAARLAALGKMSAGLTHELTQPLAAISAYVDNAKTFLEHKRFEKADDNLSEIKRLCERMGQITTHLKSYARKSTEEIEPVALKECIENALALLGGRLREHNFEIEININDDLIVMANKVRLEQVFVNLFNNALDAMKGNNKGLLKVVTRNKNNHLVITVEDNGEGIDPDIIQNIFDPFFTTKDVGVGLGLGLSISHGIIKNYGGELTAENNCEGGARFNILLPKA